MSKGASSLKHQADLALVARLLDGERQAFDTFYDSYYARVHRFCGRRMRNTHTCEDIVQLTMENAFRYLHTYHGEASLYTWLCQICRNQISTWYRRTGQKEEANVSIDDDYGLRAALESLPGALDGSSTSEDAQHIGELVQITLDGLPEEYGKALEWKYIDGLSVEEISARLRTTTIAAQSMLARARRSFRSVFKDLHQELGAG